MNEVVAIVLATGVVEDCKQPDDFFDGSGSGRQEQTIAFDAAPVRWAMDRIAIALKFTRDVLPDAGPLRSGNAHVATISTSHLFLRAICAAPNGDNVIRLRSSNRRRNWCGEKARREVRWHGCFRERPFQRGTF